MQGVVIVAHDLLIIGGGPAGLTAALYGARGGLDTVVLEQGTPGGQAGQTHWVENYPGFPEGVNGMDLVMKFLEQAQRFGAKVETAVVEETVLAGDMKKVRTGNGWYEARAAIIATGARPRSLGVPGEKEFWGRGVSYCATCDGAFFRDKKVAVIGGGDAAIEEALFLTRFASRVTVFHRRDTLRAARVLQDRAFDNPKISFGWNTLVTAIMGDNRVQSLQLQDVKTSDTRTEQFDGIFIFIGHEPNTGFLGNSLSLDDGGYIKTRENLATSEHGVFAAGDVRSKTFRQISTAVGDGAVAAMAVERYLAGL